jgi:hypothetical protein
MDSSEHDTFRAAIHGDRDAFEMIIRTQSLGQVQNFNIQTERVAQNASGLSSTAKVERDKVQLNLVISPQRRGTGRATNPSRHSHLLGAREGGAFENRDDQARGRIAQLDFHPHSRRTGTGKSGPARPDGKLSRSHEDIRGIGQSERRQYSA